MGKIGWIILQASQEDDRTTWFIKIRHPSFFSV